MVKKDKIEKEPDERLFSIPSRMIEDFLHGIPSVHHLAEGRLMKLFRKNPNFRLYLGDNMDADYLAIDEVLPKDMIRVEVAQQGVVRWEATMRISLLIQIILRGVGDGVIAKAFDDWDNKKYAAELLSSFRANL